MDVTVKSSVTPDSYLGIDISKDLLDLCLLQSEKLKHYQLPNTASGHTKLLSWLKNRKAGLVHVCLESTGSYGEAVAEALHAAGHHVSVINPSQLTHFRQVLYKQTKTDKLDCELLAQFCQKMSPSLWQPLPEPVKALRELVRLRDDLKTQLVQVTNRQETSTLNKESVASLKRQETFLRKEIEHIEQEIRQHIDRYPDLKARQDLLTSIPGVGEITSIIYMTEVSEQLASSSVRALTSYAGLAPRIRHSGKHTPRSQPISKIGNARLRRALYMAAVVAKRHNPVLKQFAQRLHDKGKAPKQVITAVMRKLLHLLFGIERHQLPFDANYIENIKLVMN